MTNSQALIEFKESMQSVKEILKIEATFNDPPTPLEVNAVLGLRGSASILMVAIFEFFMRRLFEEKLMELSKYSWVVSFDELPKRMQENQDRFAK